MTQPLYRNDCVASQAELIHLRGMLAGLIDDAIEHGGSHRESFGDWQLEASLVQPYFLPAPVPLPPSRLRCSVRRCGTLIEREEIALGSRDA